MSSSRPSSSTRPPSATTLRSEGSQRDWVAKYAASIHSPFHVFGAEHHLPQLHPAHSSDEFHFPRPEDPADIEAYFARVKATRSMPDSYNPDIEQKWMIVHNHEQLRWQEEKQKLAQVKRQTAQGHNPAGVYAKDTPEWYLKKFMDMTITSKQVTGLSVSLRTLPIS